jgi:hypothetical protein
VIFVLVHLECILCGQQTWAVIPLLMLDEPLRCGWCSESGMLPLLGETVQIVPDASPLTYDWYYKDPERVLLEAPCH